MKFTESNVNNFENIVPGDLLILEDGQKMLIVEDYDGSGYRAVNLTTNRVTDWDGHIKDLILDEINVNILRVIKGNQLTLSWN